MESKKIYLSIAMIFFLSLLYGSKESENTLKSLNYCRNAYRETFTQNSMQEPLKNQESLKGSIGNLKKDTKDTASEKKELSIRLKQCIERNKKKLLIFFLFLFRF